MSAKQHEIHFQRVLGADVYRLVVKIGGRGARRIKFQLLHPSADPPAWRKISPRSKRLFSTATQLFEAELRDHCSAPLEEKGFAQAAVEQCEECKFDVTAASVGLAALASSSSIQILLLLAANEKDLGTIAKTIDRRPSFVCKHLKILAASDFVSRRRSGANVIYSIRWDRAGKILASLGLVPGFHASKSSGMLTRASARGQGTAEIFSRSGNP